MVPQTMKVFLLVILLGVTVSTTETDVLCQSDDSGILNCVALGLTSVPLISPNYPVQSLLMSFNSLSVLKYNSFQQYQNVTELELSHNHISDIDKYAFRTLSNLVKVDLSFNILNSIHPHWFSSNLKMESLTLEGNSFHYITSPVLISSSLSSLYLSDCNIADISFNAFLGLPNLHFLDLTHNSMAHLELNNVKSLVSLHVAANSLRCDCKIYSDSERGKEIKCVHEYLIPDTDILLNETCKPEMYDDSYYYYSYEDESELPSDSSIEDGTIDNPDLKNITLFIIDDNNDSDNNNSSASPALVTSDNTYAFENISKTEFYDSDESHDFSINTYYGNTNLTIAINISDDILDMINYENESFVSSNISDVDTKIILNETFVFDDNDSGYDLYDDININDRINFDKPYDLHDDINVNYHINFDEPSDSPHDDSDLQDLDKQRNSDFDGSNVPDEYLSEDLYSGDNETRNKNVHRPSVLSYINVHNLFISLILSVIFSVVVFISVLVVHCITNKYFPRTLPVQANDDKKIEKTESKIQLLQDA